MTTISAVVYTTPPGVCGDCGGPCQPQHATCAKCVRLRRRAAKAATAPQPVIEQQPAQVTTHQGSPYRCRSHHEIHVDRRGRGCPLCSRGASR